ncbi:MAG: MFS transporter [Bacteroidales bacterium]|nr:MFS transporter [Bacteroidales bacterium]
MQLKNPDKVLIILLTGVFIGAFDIAVTGPAIASIKQYFNVDQRLLSWIFSINVLFTLVFTPFITRLSDVFGRIKIFTISLLIFLTGLLFVVLSQNYYCLLAGRAIQGIGVGGIFPVVPAIIGEYFPVSKRGHALGLIGGVFGVANIIGPLVAGFILISWSWKLLFVINIPLVVFVIISAIKVLPKDKIKHKLKFDVLGSILLGLAIGTFAFGINKINTHDIFNSLLNDFFLYFIFSVFIFLILIFVEKRAENPVISTKFFKSRQIKIAFALALGTGFFQACFIFFPNMLSENLNITASKASFMLLPIVLAMSVGAPLAGKIVDITGSKKVLLTGLSFVFVGLIIISIFTATNLYYFAGFVFGLGLSSLESSGVRYIMLNEVNPDERATAQGMVSIFISSGQLISASLIGAVAASYSGIFSSGYNYSFLLISILALLLIVIGFFLKSKNNEIDE